MPEGAQVGSKIAKVAYYLPDTIVTNSALENEFETWDADKIEEKTGIRERHIAKENETSLDLAYKACLKIFEIYNKNEIDFLLLCTQSPDYFLPSSACILQDRLHLPTSIGALDFNLGCSGYIYGLAIAKGLIQSQIAERILLVTAEAYSKFIHTKDRSNRTIFGDGAAATLVEKVPEEGIHEFVLGTDGSGHQNLIVPFGGLRNKFDPNDEEIVDKGGNIRTNNNLYMNGPEIFNFTIKAVPVAVSKILEKNNLAIEDVDYFIFHQANKYMIEYLRKKIKIPKERFYMNLLNTGNTVSSTIPIAIADSLASHVIAPGNKILVVGFGVGYSWGGTIIEI